MVLSYLAPYSRHLIVIGLAVVLFVVLSREPAVMEEPQSSPGESAERLLSDAELAQYDGREGSKGLYLVILGHVYDVATGAKHYGPGEAYNMFVGHDASRSFISGDFEQYEPEMSDVSSLTDREIKSIVSWKAFYDKTYTYVGRHVGRYFDAGGQTTEYYKLVLERAARAEADEARGQEFPSCNVEWKQETGTRVWCSSRSGDGVERGWVGLPRRYVQQEDKTPFCVCVPEEHQPSEAMAPFADCDETSDSCFVKEA